MKAKTEEKEKAIEMRKEGGQSVNEIAQTLGVSKGSISLWLKGIPQPEKFTVEYRAQRKKERLDGIKKLSEFRKDKDHPSDEVIDLHLESVKKTGQPILSRRLLTGDGKWMIPAPDYYTGKKYIKNRYVYEHRLIVEKFLGRLLNENETVHHIDKDKLNNRLENLEIKCRETAKFPASPGILRVHSRGKYKSVVIPGHPYADKRDRVLLHRFIMEQHLGRYLTPAEVVHHKDENTKNNDITNLEIMSSSGHSSHHGSKVKTAIVDLVCLKCGGVFSRSKRRVNLKKKAIFVVGHAQ